MVITELDTDRLSVLQQDLLARALLAWEAEPDLTKPALDPKAGCLDLKTLLRAETDRRKRAVRRAAAGRAVARLVYRGLLERCARGKWRLTPTGIEVAKAIHPSSKR
jgi:hypothetical protein